jgi:hypothetical protein
MVAATSGQIDIVTVLINSGADVNAANQYGETALILVAKSVQTATATATALALIAAGADVHAANKMGNTALSTAAAYGHAAIVTALIAASANVNTANQKGWTALMEAAATGHTAVVTALISAGADVNAASSSLGWTALMAAAENGNTTIASILITAGANLSATAQKGDTALMVASRESSSLWETNPMIISRKREARHETAFRLLNAMPPQEISASRPSLMNRFLRRQPAITHTQVETAYNQALIEFRQGLRNVFSAFNEGASRHDLGTANALLNIIADYYAPNWFGNPNQEISHALTERRKPVILSCTARAMNRLRSTLTSLTNAETPALFRFTEEPAAEQGPRKKARCE